jgi:hypothetical protein
MDRLTIIALTVSLVAVAASIFLPSPRVRRGATLALLAYLLIDLRYGIRISARYVELPPEVGEECFKHWHSARMATQAEVDRYLVPIAVVAIGLALISLTAGLKRSKPRG